MPLGIRLLFKVTQKFSSCVNGDFSSFIFLTFFHIFATFCSYLFINGFPRFHYRTYMERCMEFLRSTTDAAYTDKSRLHFCCLFLGCTQMHHYLRNFCFFVNFYLHVHWGYLCSFHLFILIIFPFLCCTVLFVDIWTIKTILMYTYVLCAAFNRKKVTGILRQYAMHFYDIWRSIWFVI